MKQDQFAVFKKAACGTLSRNLLMLPAPASAIPSTPDFAEFLVKHGLAPVFLHAAKNECPPSLAESLAPFPVRAAAYNTMLFSAVDGFIYAADFPVIPMKGVALSAKIYPSPFLRPMQDADLLVHEKDLPSAKKLLASLGFAPLELPSEDGYQSLNSIYFRKELPGDAFADIHLHWHWINASYYLGFERIDIERVWSFARPAPWPGGLEAHALPPELELLFLAEHSLKHNYRTLVKLLDIALLVRKTPPEWNACLKIAEEFNLSPALRLALVLTDDAFPGAIPGPVLAKANARPVSRLERRFETMAKNGIIRTGMNWQVYSAMCGGWERFGAATKAVASLAARNGGMRRLKDSMSILKRLSEKK